MKKKKMNLSALLFAMVFAVCGCTDNQGKGVADVEDVFQKQTEDISKNKAMGDREKDQEIPEYIKPEMKGELTVSCFGEYEFLNTAAKQFMDEYPDITVTINDYAEHLDMPSERDYQTAFNTKLMGGDAEDIIFNYCLPVTKYSEMGAFEDLSTYISQTPEMNDENYYMNVLRAAQNEDGEINIIPYEAGIETFGFSVELLKEHGDIENTLQGKKNICFSEMLDLAEQLVEGKSPSKNVFLGNLNPVEYIKYWIKDSLNDFIDLEQKEVHLDTPEYIDMLNSVKKLTDEGWFDTQDMDFYNTKYDIAVSPMGLALQSAADAIDSKERSYCMPLADKQGNVAINANYGIALNSSSKHKELAWEFIKYLLSDEVQSQPSVYGLSVNRQGFEKSVERWHDNNGIRGSLEDYRNVLENWMEQVNACDMLDDSIVELMRVENEKFFNGQQSAEETAKTLQKQVEQYFNE